MKKNIGPHLGIYPTSIVLVGTYDSEEKANISTIAWAGVCCSEPPSVQISVRKSRYTHAAILKRRVFSVNIPSVEYLKEVDYCGFVSGKNDDKFTATQLTPLRGGTLDVPLVNEFPISMECKLTHSLEIGSHDLFVGEIVACWVDRKALTPSGDIDSVQVGSFVFMPSGEYYAVGQLLDRSHSPGRALLHTELET